MVSGALGIIHLRGWRVSIALICERILGKSQVNKQTYQAMCLVDKTQAQIYIQIQEF